MSLAGFDWRQLNSQFMRKPENRAVAYGVGITMTAAREAWRCIGVYHLAASENNGRHNLFLDLLDKDGKRVRNVDVVYGWDATPRVLKLDKPDNEPAGDIPLYAGSARWVRVGSGEPSDMVTGVHSMHKDEPPGNTWGHHSFYVVFQWRSVGEPPPIEPPPSTIEKRVAVLEDEMIALHAMLKDVVSTIQTWTGE